MLNTLDQFHRTGMHRTGSRSSHRIASTTPGSPHPHGVTTPTRHTRTREYRFPPGRPNHQPRHHTGGQHPHHHTGVIATTCFRMCAHGLGAPHPHLRMVHPILGVLTHITDACICSFIFVFVYTSSYTYGKQNSRPTRLQHFTPTRPTRRHRLITH